MLGLELQVGDLVRLHSQYKNPFCNILNYVAMQMLKCSLAVSKSGVYYIILFLSTGGTDIGKAADSFLPHFLDVLTFALSGYLDPQPTHSFSFIITNALCMQTVLEIDG